MTTRMCPVCKHDMVNRKVEHAYWHDDILVAVVKEVPSWVCLLCGHRIMEHKVTTTLRNIVEDYIRLGKTFPIPSTMYRPVPS
jgi:YgiT-type zinc finger domain-containing protein